MQRPPFVCQRAQPSLAPVNVCFPVLLIVAQKCGDGGRVCGDAERSG